MAARRRGAKKVGRRIASQSLNLEYHPCLARRTLWYVPGCWIGMGRVNRNWESTQRAFYELPMRIPEIKTSTPPTITCKAAERKGVSI